MSIEFIGLTAIFGSQNAVTVAWPTHIENDVAFLLVESTGGEPTSLSTPNGFAAVTGSPQATGAGTAGTQLSVYWCRATSAAMASPVVADAGNHVITAMVTFRGCITTGNPWNITAGSVKSVAGTACTHPAVITTVDDALIVLFASRDLSGVAGNVWNGTYTNANLINITEQVNGGGSAGNGGSLLCVTGTKAVRGNTGTTASTMNASQVNGFLTVALIPSKGSFFPMF